MSERMLKEAKKKGVYSRLRKIVLGPDMELDGKEYDAVICVGTLKVTLLKNRFYSCLRRRGHMGISYLP